MSDWRKLSRGHNQRPPGRPLPHGIIDRFWQEATALREVEATLRDLYRAWGYTEYVPPTFEYADTLSQGAGIPLQEQMYRFFDRDGKVLALRPDMTIPTARLVGSKLFDQPFPQRFFYTGPVFRYVEPAAGMPREFYQAGVELIGAKSPEADGEILALAVESLRSLGLRDFRIVLGQMAFFHGLLEALALNGEDEAALRLALDRKSDPALRALVERWGLTGVTREAVMRLPHLHGTEGVLAAAQEVALNETMLAALENLRAIEKVVDAYGVKEAITLDLAEVRGMEYYTGITFEGFVPGLGVAVLSGGRYDNLVASFGPPQPAVGFAITLERAMRARESQGISQGNWLPDVVVSGCLTTAHVSRVRQARESGLRVAWHYGAQKKDALWAYAERLGIPRAVWCERGKAWLWEKGTIRELDDEEWYAHIEQRGPTEREQSPPSSQPVEDKN